MVTESRLDLAEWTDGAAERVAALGLTPRVLARADLAGANDIIGSWPRDAAIDRTMAVISSLYHANAADAAALGEVISRDPDALLALIQAHPLVHDLVRATEQARHLGELAEALFPEPATGPTTSDEDDRLTFLTHLTAALSHVRVLVGRAALGVDLHLWVRELTRIDRVAGAAPRYRWGDDGELTDPGDAAGEQRAFPAIYCRHCGRSGWGVGLAPVGSNLDTDDNVIRRNHAAREGRFRALIYAPLEAEHGPGLDTPDGAVEGLRWLSIRERMLLSAPPADDDPDYREGRVLPVLTQVGPDADDESNDDTCPSCQQKDGIRFLGSAIATLLSVTLSTLFGDQALDAREKKALVFTDSVQDAAHRAGFVESRSHTLTLRALLRHAVGDHPVGLDSLVDQAIAAAGDDPFSRYRIISARPGRTDRVRAVLAAAARPRGSGRSADAGPAAAAVRRGARVRPAVPGRPHSGADRQRGGRGRRRPAVGARQPRPRGARRHRRCTTPSTGTWPRSTDESLVAWVRGVLEHMRVEGAVEHEWFDDFIRHDGNRYWIWGGRRRSQGMPAFPRGRSAPAFPRIGPAAQVRDPLLVNVTSPQSWYARWTARTLGVPAAHGARLARQLLERLARADVLHTVATETGGTVFAIPASSVVVSPTDPDEMRGRAQPAHLHRLPHPAVRHRDRRRAARRRAVHAGALPGPAAPRVARATTTTAACTRRRTCAGSSPGSTPA